MTVSKDGNEFRATAFGYGNVAYGRTPGMALDALRRELRMNPLPTVAYTRRRSIRDQSLQSRYIRHRGS